MFLGQNVELVIIDLIQFRFVFHKSRKPKSTLVSLSFLRERCNNRKYTSVIETLLELIVFTFISVTYVWILYLPLTAVLVRPSENVF